MIHIKHLLTLFFISLLTLNVGAQTLTTDSIELEVLLESSICNIRVKLYNDTPIHRDNFLKLVRQGFYDGLLFHRVIPDFMIQAGDSASRHAKEGVLLGDSPEPYTLPAEIHFPTHFHRRGALAAAREGDEKNPQRASSYSQFYIVTGSIFTDDGLDVMQERLDSTTHNTIKLTPKIKEVYRTFGGAPHLDGQYTVFGEVVEGFDVTDLIQWASRDENNRPFDDIRIIKATVVK
uniref:peptidylprolyl isomerase n=1 Tax=Alloprevotella sp. TaxID=1872471 RepID=UPI003FF0BE70